MIQKQNASGEQLVAALYARVSSGKQLQGFSLNEQIRLGRKRCDQKGWTIGYIFKEKGVTAKSIDRPKFLKMLEKARERRFDILVFWRLDRFARSLRDVVNVQKYLEQYDISLHSLTELIDTSTAVGKFSFRNLASAAELERELIGERCRMGLHALALQHKWPGRKIPIGYSKNHEGHLEINREEATLIRDIFKQYIKKKSMPLVAEWLNQNHVLISSKKIGPWKTWDVKRILDNKMYLGNFIAAGVYDEKPDLQCIPVHLFEKAQKIKKRYRNRKNPMSVTRKKQKVEKMITNYLKYLNDLEQEQILDNKDFGIQSLSANKFHQ